MKAILTVLGKDKAGIIATVATILAQNNINIEDISQTVMQGYFTMIMLVNLENSAISFGELQELAAKKGEEIGVKIMVQHEDIFNSMHRV